MYKYLLFIFLSFAKIDCFSQAVLPLKERVRAIEEIQKDRLKNLLPQLMEREKIDCWVIITREYNEDPIIKSLLPPTWLNARRRTILVFTLDESSNKVDMSAITRYSFGSIIESVWDKEKEPDQMKALVHYLKLKNPKKIGINISDTYGIADGLSVTDHKLLMNYLPQPLKKRVISSEPLAVSWVETRTEKEMTLFSHLTEITHNIIKDAFSTVVITPGVTTTDDVVWWMREKVSSMGLKTWFHPTIDVQRADDSDLYAFDAKQKFDIIQPGDLVHCDFGINYSDTVVVTSPSQDQNGNAIFSKTYGNQEWSTQSANVTTYRDGTPIPEVTDPGEWADLTTGAWCYPNGQSQGTGKLYNWYAIMGVHDNDPNTPNKEFAPAGWHIPNDQDWQEIERYLMDNGYSFDGNQNWLSS